jgi:cytochrome c oxidase subunit 2
MRRLLFISPIFLLTTGCATVQSTLGGSGPAARRIASMQWLMILLFLGVTLIMWVLVVWGVSRRRGTLEEHEPIDAGGGHAWITIGGMFIPLSILSVLFILSLFLLNSFPIHDPGHAATPPAMVVIGHQWWWEVHYLNKNPQLDVTTANEIHIPVNKPVTIELKSADVTHAFWIPALHGKVDMIPGHPNFIRIEASHSGTYKGECAEFCGVQHAHMRLLLIAQPQEQYQAWLDNLRQPGRTPTTPAAIAGEQVFVMGPCSQCHTVRGTAAHGAFGPALTHIGSRRMIGADSFPNNKGYLAGWVTHAQSLKPGAKMPNITQLTGIQLRDLVAYLQQLQ